MRKQGMIAAFMALLLLCTALAGCTGKENKPDATGGSTAEAALIQTKIAAIKGPTGIGIAKLTQDTALYNISFVGAPTEVPAMLTSKSVDIAAMPLNLAASLYHKTNGAIQMLAVNTLGVLYILENGNSIQSVADLKGKTIYASVPGATTEYMLRYILQANGLADDVTIEFKSEHSELATLAATGNIAICMLPEPHVTAALKQNTDLRIALDMTELWEAALAKSGQIGSLAQGCIVVRKTFAQEHPREVAAFMQAYQASVQFINNDTEAAAELVANAEILPSAAVAKQAIPNCNIVCITGEEMKTLAMQNLQVLLDADAVSVGGAMPGDDFYTQ